MAAAKAKSRCHEIREQQRLSGDYDLDYSSEGLGEAEDPCEEAVKQAKQVALLAAAEKGQSLDGKAGAEAGQQPAGVPSWGVVKATQTAAGQLQHMTPTCLCLAADPAFKFASARSCSG